MPALPRPGKDLTRGHIRPELQGYPGLVWSSQLMVQKTAISIEILCKNQSEKILNILSKHTTRHLDMLWIIYHIWAAGSQPHPLHHITWRRLNQTKKAFNPHYYVCSLCVFCSLDVSQSATLNTRSEFFSIYIWSNNTRLSTEGWAVSLNKIIILYRVYCTYMYYSI